MGRARHERLGSLENLVGQTEHFRHTCCGEGALSRQVDRTDDNPETARTL